MKSHTTAYTKHFSPALAWLFCILCVLLGNHNALAQGTVSVSVSTSVSQVTVGIGTAASFTATASASVTPDKEWSIQSGPTYSWSATPSPASGSPANQATTTVSATYNAAGTNPIQATCTVSYVMVKSDPGDPSDGSTATISGSNSPAVTVPIYVIGGPITGTNDESYYCTPNDVGAYAYLSAASGQPAGTTYSWSMSGNATYCDPSNEGQPTTPTTASVTYRGIHPGSSAVGDVTATVSYSLNGVSITSPKFPITVHCPMFFSILSKNPPTKIVPPNPKAYGFSGQSITFQILDGLHKVLKSGNGQTPSWDESWNNPNVGPAPTFQGGGALDGNGESEDDFDWEGASQPQNPSGDVLQGPLTHIYCVTDTEGTGGLIGCQVQQYTNVYYYTYGLTGNGF